MVWRCRRQRVQRFFLRCYKKDFGEKWSRTRYRFSTSLLKSRVSREPVGRVLWGREIGFAMTWTGSVGKRSGARGAMSVSASKSGGRVSWTWAL